MLCRPRIAEVHGGRERKGFPISIGTDLKRLLFVPSLGCFGRREHVLASKRVALSRMTRSTMSALPWKRAAFSRTTSGQNSEWALAPVGAGIPRGLNPLGIHLKSSFPPG